MTLSRLGFKIKAVHDGHATAHLDFSENGGAGRRATEALMATGLRLIVFDETQTRRPPRALGLSWRVGSELYQKLGWVDGAHGARSFAEALDWLASFEPTRAIGEVQFWGHGKWGRVLIDRESFDRTALSPGHALRPRVEALRERLSDDSLIWFRTCETLGANAGHDFARALGDFTGAAVAGHTFVIGYFQSGLHLLRPGATPDWHPAEGLASGTADAPITALSSSPAHVNTITCFTHEVPGELASG